MGLESRIDLLENIMQIKEESANADKEIAIISARIEEFDNIHGRFEQLYGNKYGINRRTMNRRISGYELDRMMHLVRAENSQPHKAGFLGMGGMKKEEYYTLTDKINLIRSNFHGLIDDWNNYLQEKINVVKDKFGEYEKSYVENLSGYNEAVREESANLPETVRDSKLCLGKIRMETPDSERIRNTFEKNSQNSVSAKQISLLLTQNMDQPEPCFILFEKSEERELLNAFIRNLMKQFMYNMPLYQYEFYYLDGMNNCSGLREMLELQNMQDAYADSIVPQLCTDGFQMLHVGRDSDGIHRALVDLERYMGQVTDILRGKPSFTEYNRNNEEKIPYKLVILEGIGVNMDASLVRKLVINGPKCGIFVLIIQDKNELPPENQYSSQKCERMVLADTMAQIIYKQGSPQFSFRPVGKEIPSEIKGEERKYYSVSLFDEDNDYSSYVSAVLKEKNSSKLCDNSFSSCFPEDYTYGRYTSTVETANGNLEGRIEIPFAVDRRGRISSIELGSANYAHGLISGATGSGKSTMLHMLINSVVMNYHPDDVEIWLADYKKVELSVYITERPPHIKFIGIERNEEFTFSLLDLIAAEYERRLELFRQENVRNIDIYKKIHGMGSIPRILLIIDEFHLMSQQVYDNEVYSRKLENLLAEGRGVGIVCLFADQAISKGLNGLTQKGKDQMRMRLAMANTKEEMAVTLDMNKVSDAEASLDKGEVQVKRTRMQRNPDGTEEKITYLDMEKVIYISDECRREVARKAIELYGEGREALVVDGNKPAVYDAALAGEYERIADDGRPTCYLHLGKPSNLEKCFAIPLTRNYGDNVMCILDKSDLQRRVFLSALNSFLREQGRRVYVISDDNDNFFCKMRKELNDMSMENNSLRICSEYDIICDTILKLSEELVSRRSLQKKDNILIFWFGLESMLKEFSYYPALKEENKGGKSNSAIIDIQRELDAKFAKLFGGDLPEHAVTESRLYNASDKIAELVSEGGKRGIYNFVFYSSVLSIKMAKNISSENFKFKISGFMNKDDCYKFFGTSKFMDSIGEKPGDMLVCHDGDKGRFFLPYLVEEH